ncbi:sensor histidine kinase [Nonomuraea jiangxiensis]|uniref:histidine kinase n=1 Tax=Nonomuraea jiangxiensis TaxID=633440 RepID=A0A1G9QHR0_9ACTN|nr:HAMP domain-containing sensor histidine kinase [Nonomuraea jiangxiensis]SDM10582.1 Signal transduction histidine kinase [Nonomuraea jiangxiensis]
MTARWPGAAVLSSVRLRATAAATLVVALALGGVALALVTALRGTLESSADAEAAKKAAAAAPYVETRKVGPGQVKPPQEEGKLIMRHDGTVTKVADPDVLLTKGRTAVTKPLPDDGIGGWAKPDEYAVAARKVSTATGPAVLWSRVSLEGVAQALQTLYAALLPGVPAVLLVVAGMTWLSMGRALAPVAAIRAKLAHITARDLHQRVPVPDSKDEIAALATTVNGTLDRLETAVERHKRFVADAAHELRSPIATLRARLELAEPSELTQEALADVERLQHLAADLLLLAKLDAGEPLRAAELDLGQVAAEEALRRGSARRRPEVRMELDIEPDVVMRGSRAHLDRLVTNLTDNAVRHAASTVRVRVRAEHHQAVLEVLDDGPGIPPEQREAVFDRFTRLDEARARDAGGAGLGLPIARDIAVLHDGSLVYGGSGFVAKFPLKPA